MEVRLYSYIDGETITKVNHLLPFPLYAGRHLAAVFPRVSVADA